MPTGLGLPMPWRSSKANRMPTPLDRFVSEQQLKVPVDWVADSMIFEGERDELNL